MSHPVAEYLHELYLISGVSVPETSGYPALSKLLNAVGDSLKPKITAVIHPSNNGAGIPDGGLYSAKELKKYGADEEPLMKLKPERGVIEVKALDADLSSFESSPQVRNYLEHYGQILLTNYRSFAIWSWRGGKAVAGERYTIAPNANEFWSRSHTIRNDPKHPEHERLWQFLRRALLSTARIATPQDLALYLASYAREARARIETKPLPTLDPIKTAISDALGVRFEGEKGVHFFQSTLIQTLFYGIFSAWVLWHEEHSKTTDRFQWRLSAQYLGLPILRTLFVQLAGDPKKVRALDLEEVLDWTEDCLARVDRASFFARYDMGDAVQYFYEPFLAEFDPELRKDFGVWYTPPEIVRYMVGSVDKALRENFHLADGLADPSVIVLDPCCGTGAYLVETLKLIRRRLVEGYGESQAGLKIKEVAKHRLYGFELLPAPYVVSHLQIDLMLTRWGAALDHEKDERAGVFLTNALTGWVPIKSPKDLPFSEFTAERDAADHVKQQEQILVILGNPPYDGYAGMAVEEERNLSEAYRDTKEAPKPQGQGLNDLYIRFFRMAERRIAEGVPQSDDPKPGPPREDAKGIICFISNYSWLDGLSHTGMRERFMEVFDTIHIDCLNGDKYKTGKKTPDGQPDPSVFSTEKNREGIQVGTAIALLERRPSRRVRQNAESGTASEDDSRSLATAPTEGRRARQSTEGVESTAPEPRSLATAPTEGRRARQSTEGGEFTTPEPRSLATAPTEGRRARQSTEGGEFSPPDPRSLATAPTGYQPRAELGFRHWWGKEKRAELAASLGEPKPMQSLKPTLAFGLPFVPMGMNSDYHSWCLMTDLLPQAFPGVTSGRDEALVDFDRAALVQRMQAYFDPSTSDASAKRLVPCLMEKTQRFDPKAVRDYLTKRGFKPDKIVRFCYRPFDVRWLYWEPETKLLDEKRREFFKQVFAGNIFIEARQRQVKDDWNRGYVTTCLADSLGNGRSSFFPLYLQTETDDEATDQAHPDLFAPAKPSGPQPNLTDFARKYLAGLKCGAEELFFHIVAVLHAPLYREENAGALRQDWPRVPLPKTAKVLQAGAALGRQIAALLDPETPVEGVTTLQVRPDLKGLGELAVKEGSADTPVRIEPTGGEAAKNKKAGKSAHAPLKAKQALTPDLAIAARWGYAGQGGVTMPGPGKVTTGTRGEGYLDIHLNATTRWKDVPEPVWNYTLGGYQVLKKWLSYRESALLGRALTSDEAQQFTHHVRRIASILALHEKLDAHYGASV